MSRTIIFYVEYLIVYVSQTMQFPSGNDALSVEYLYCRMYEMARMFAHIAISWMADCTKAGIRYSVGHGNMGSESGPNPAWPG